MSSLNASRLVLVTGATGQQGGALAKQLLAAGHKVRALTRKPDSAPALALKAAGAELVVGDFAQPSTLAAAVQGVDTVFAMGTPYEVGPEAETEQGLALVKAAQGASVKHFVFSSVAGADRKTKIPHFDSKAKVEEALRATDMPWTILAPVFFMDNLQSPWWLPAIKEGAFPMGIPSDRKLQHIAVEDIGKFAALVIARRDEFLGKRIDLASDEVTGTEVAALLTKLANRPINYVAVPLEDVRKQNADFAAMYDWFNRVGYSADIKGLRASYPEVGWHRVSEWAQTRTW